MTTEGSLCTGYNGLGMAVEAVLGTSLSWVSEIDRHASALLAERYPEVPNLGDLKTIDWGTVPRVDVLTAGYPCQPFSQAGKRAGSDDPRHLWPFIRDAIGVLRPSLVVLENVRGHLTLGFEQVLADLHALRFHAEWSLVRASDVGACHQRARLFIVAAHSDRGRGDIWPWPAHAEGEIVQPTNGHLAATDPQRIQGGLGHDASGVGGRQGQAQQAGVGSVSAPDASSAGAGRLDRAVSGAAQEGGRSSLDVPAVVDGSEAPTDARRHGLGLGPERDSQASAGLEAPCGHDADRCTDPAPNTDLSGPQGAQPAQRRDLSSWGGYGDGIERHELIFGRTPPSPVDEKGRLNPPFVEWMMMLPEGWVTSLPLARTQQLKMLGNGVVPLQAAYAISELVGRLS